MTADALYDLLNNYFDVTLISNVLTAIGFFPWINACENNIIDNTKPCRICITCAGSYLWQLQLELLDCDVDATEGASVDGGEGALSEHVPGAPLHVTLSHFALRQHVATLQALHLVLQAPNGEQAQNRCFI